MELIKSIKTFSFIRYIADKALTELGGDACSIYLQSESNKSEFTLCESVPYSNTETGIRTIDMNERAAHEKSSKGLLNLSITYCCLRNKKTIIVDDIESDIRWSGYNHVDHKIYSFGLTSGKAGPLILTPLLYNMEIFGLIRIVREKLCSSSSPNKFTEKDRGKIEAFSESISPLLFEANKIEQLLEAGVFFSLKDFCKDAITSIPNLVSDEASCSIFLLNKYKSSPRSKRFYGLSSTGYLIDAHNNFFSNDAAWNEAYYEIIPDNEPSSFTKAAIVKDKVVLVDDICDRTELRAVNNKLAATRPEQKEGTLNEATIDKKRLDTGSILYVPIPSRDGNSIIGLLRVNKVRRVNKKTGKNTNTFTKAEIDSILLYQDKIAKIITGIYFHETIEKINSFYNATKLLDFITEEITDIVGGRGSSIFLYNSEQNVLDFKATSGPLQGGKGIESYELGVGYTGWAGKHLKSLWFNKPSDIHGAYGIEDKPKWSKRKNQCETGQIKSGKLACIPLISSTNTLMGIIRVAKKLRDTNFTRGDIYKLESIAKKISTRLQEIKTNSLLEFAHSKLVDNSVNKEDRIIYNYLTFITHDKGLRFNRAIFLNYNEPNADIILDGRVGIGPENLREAVHLREDLEGANFTIMDSLERFNINNRFPESYLQSAVTKLKIKTIKGCIFASERLQNLKRRGSIEEENINNVKGTNKEVLSKLDFKDFLLCPVVVQDELHGVILIDNPYIGFSKTPDNQMEVLSSTIKKLESILLGRESKRNEDPEETGKSTAEADSRDGHNGIKIINNISSTATASSNAVANITEMRTIQAEAIDKAINHLNEIIDKNRDLSQNAKKEATVIANEFEKRSTEARSDKDKQNLLTDVLDKVVYYSQRSGPFISILKDIISIIPNS